jgi:alpha-L-arabinofuranosidase
MRMASGAENDDYNWTECLLSHISVRWLQGVGAHYYTGAGGRTDASGKAVTSGREAVDATDFTEDQYFHSRSRLHPQHFQQPLRSVRMANLAQIANVLQSLILTSAIVHEVFDERHCACSQHIFWYLNPLGISGESPRFNTRRSMSVRLNAQQ